MNRNSLFNQIQSLFYRFFVYLLITHEITSQNYVHEYRVLFQSSYKDMSQNHSGSLMMLGCVISSLVGAAVPFITGLILGDDVVKQFLWIVLVDNLNCLRRVKLKLYYSLRWIQEDGELWLFPCQASTSSAISCTPCWEATRDRTGTCRGLEKTWCISMGLLVLKYACTRHKDLSD